MLAFLGWNPGNNKEIFSLEELVEEFSLERVENQGQGMTIKKQNGLINNI